MSMIGKLRRERALLLCSSSLLAFLACSSGPPMDSSGNDGTGGSGGSPLNGKGGSPGGGAASGGAPAFGGEGSGGRPQPTGGTSTTGGAEGVGGSAAGTCGGEPLLEAGGEVFDCGALGHVFENAGRPDNRVNYIIVGDGYDEELVATTFLEHVENMLHEEQGGMFSALGEPYGRYRKFINICALKIASNDACIDNPDIGRSCDTPFDGRCEPPCGPDGTRLGVVDVNKVNRVLAQALPAALDVDWAAVSLNADTDGWWNSGGPIMVWNGAFGNRLHAASVALHEGGHTFHSLADEYGGTSVNCGEFGEVNSTADPTGESKWSHWIGYDDIRDDARPRPSNQNMNPYGTREQGVFEGSRYCDRGQYRPSRDSEMNLLPRPFNMPSIEKIITDIYSIVSPVDAHTNNDVPLVNPTSLQVRVVDAELLELEWSIDGATIGGATDECFVLPDLTPGAHEVSVRVSDPTPWVRSGRHRLALTVSWQVIIQ